MPWQCYFITAAIKLACCYFIAMLTVQISGDVATIQRKGKEARGWGCRRCYVDYVPDIPAYWCCCFAMPLHLKTASWLSRKNEQLGVCAPDPHTPPTQKKNHWQALLKPRANFKHFKDRLIWRARSNNEARPWRLKILHNGYVSHKSNENQVLYQHYSW